MGEAEQHGKKRRLGGNTDHQQHCSTSQDKSKATEGLAEAEHRTQQTQGCHAEACAGCCEESTALAAVRKAKKHAKQKATKKHKRQASKTKTGDSEQHKRQARKRKPEDSEEHERQAKKRKEDESEQHKRQARKRKADDSEVHDSQAKKRRPKASRRRGESVKELLRLQMNAERVIVRGIDVSDFRRVDLDKHSRVECTVRGHACVVLLDSGAEVSVMTMSMAERMGLITGAEPKMKQTFGLQTGVVSLDVVMLSEVVITLKGGVEVNTPMRVFPKEVEHYIGEMVLSMSRLEEAGMVHQFRPDGSSSLFLRHPERLRRPASFCMGKKYMFTVRAARSAKPLTVVVDTADYVMLGASKAIVARLTGQCTEKPPPRAWIQFERGLGPVVDVVYKSCLQNHAFLCGRGLLGDCSAVLDYISHTVTFSLGKTRLYRGALYSEGCSGVHSD